MKMWKRILVSAVTAAMTFTLLTGSVFAAQGNESTTKPSYTYTARFFAGNQGKFSSDVASFINIERMDADGNKKQITPNPVFSDDNNSFCLSNLEKGDVVTFDAQKEENGPDVVKLSDSKYYVKGVRVSGRDNNEATGTVFRVNADQDYVVAYGIRGQQVKYTVNYQDSNGKELIPSNTFFGNVGDKVIVAYKYIEGYAPRAYAEAKTLVANEAENVFTFVYDKVSGPTTKVETEIVETTETVEQIIGSTVVIGGGGTGGATNVTGGGEGTGAENEDAEATGGADTEGAGEGEETGGDDLIVDLDEETPLANIDADGEANGNMAPMALYVGMGLLALLAIIVAVYLTQKLKKKEEA